MRKTANYELNIAEGSDRYNHLTIDNPNYQKIDITMKENEDSAVQTATELKSGTVHAITRNKPNASMFRFVATSDYTSGETFTVDGQQVTALLPNGATLGTGAYHVNANVLCCLVGTNMTVYTIGVAENVDASTLEGHGADYFATADGLNDAKQIAQSAQIVANSTNEKIGSLGFSFEKVWENKKGFGYNEPQTFPEKLNLTSLIALEYWTESPDYANFVIMKSNDSCTVSWCSSSGSMTREIGVWTDTINPRGIRTYGNIASSYLTPKAIYNIVIK